LSADFENFADELQRRIKSELELRERAYLVMAE